MTTIVPVCSLLGSFEADEQVFRNLGYNLHSSIVANLPASPRIADVATGTGIWMFDIARDFSPKPVTLDGFDISDLQFAKGDALPDNITFHVHNAKEPFPSELHGQFDAIHIRLILAAISDNDLEQISRNALELLKPGGGIQWGEYDLRRLEYLPGPGADALFPTNLAAVGQAFKDLFLVKCATATELLHGIFKDKLGMVDVRREITLTDKVPQGGLSITKQWAGLVRPWAKTQAEHFGGDEECERVLDGMDREIEEGAYMRNEIVVTYGFWLDSGH